MDGLNAGKVPGEVVCDAAAALKIQRLEILGVVTRADGTIEDLGVLAASNFEQLKAVYRPERQRVLRFRAKLTEINNAA